MRVLLFAVGSLCLGACGKKADEAAPAPSAGSSAGSGGSSAAPTASGSAGAPSKLATPGTSRFVYPPAGSGPHEGFDLAAIHAKLQGAWLVGGSAFSSIPKVWSLEGDTLTQIGEDGQRSTSTLRLLAPCYFFEGEAEGGSGSYGHFVFDGDTLYQGLGNAGLVQGDRTIGCMSAAMYVLDGGTCTRWTKRSFSKPGEQEWEKEPGECRYSDDRTTFQGDDTSSKRKIYGIETLSVRGKVLLTQQMEGNKAERFASLDAAIAKQKELVDAKHALTQTPKDLPFKDWGVESSAPAYEPNVPVWAASVGRDGMWSFGMGRFKKFEEGAVWVAGMRDAWAPSSFVVAGAATADLAAGSPVLLGIGALLPYGRFVKLDGDKAIVQYKSANRVEEKPIDANRVLPLKRAAWTLGAPLAMKVDDHWSTARLVLDAGDHAYASGSAGVVKVAKTELRLIDVGKRWTKGAKVWAMQPSGFSPLKFVEGTIDKVHGNGLFFTIKAGDKIFDQSYDGLVDTL